MEIHLRRGYTEIRHWQSFQVAPSRIMIAPENIEFVCNGQSSHIRAQADKPRTSPQVFEPETVYPRFTLIFRHTEPAFPGQG